MRISYMLLVLLLTLTSTKIMLPSNNSGQQQRFTHTKNIKALHKRIKELTAKLEVLEEKTEEQELVLDLNKKISNNEGMSKFNWKNFFTKVKSVGIGKAAILIITLGTVTGLINPLNILKQITGIAARWICRALWCITKQALQTMANGATITAEAIKEGYHDLQEDYAQDKQEGYPHGLYNYVANGCKKIIDPDGNVIKDFDKPGIEAAVNWMYL